MIVYISPSYVISKLGLDINILSSLNKTLYITSVPYVVTDITWLNVEIAFV
jgi:hypothetical protein